MNAIRHQSDSATAARFIARQKHAEQIPQRDNYGQLHTLRVKRAKRNRREVWPQRGEMQ